MVAWQGALAGAVQWVQAIASAQAGTPLPVRHAVMYMYAPYNIQGRQVRYMDPSLLGTPCNYTLSTVDLTMHLSRPERPGFIQASLNDLYYSCTDPPTLVGRHRCTRSTLAIHCVLTGRRGAR